MFVLKIFNIYQISVFFNIFIKTVFFYCSFSNPPLRLKTHLTLYCPNRHLTKTLSSLLIATSDSNLRSPLPIATSGRHRRSPAPPPVHRPSETPVPLGKFTDKFTRMTIRFRLFILGIVPFSGEITAGHRR